MRTVLLFGLTAISDAIGKQTGYEMSDRVAFIGALLFIFAIIADLMDVSK